MNIGIFSISTAVVGFSCDAAFPSDSNFYKNMSLWGQLLYLMLWCVAQFYVGNTTCCRTQRLQLHTWGAFNTGFATNHSDFIYCNLTEVVPLLYLMLGYVAQFFVVEILLWALLVQTWGAFNAGFVLSMGSSSQWARFAQRFQPSTFIQLSEEVTHTVVQNVRGESQLGQCGTSL